MFDIDLGTGDGVVSLDFLMVAYSSGNVTGFSFFSTVGAGRWTSKSGLEYRSEA